jgi:hypothetical protein
VNEEIWLLDLQSPTSYDALFKKFESQKSSLPPTQNTRGQRPAPSTLAESPSESDSTTTFVDVQCLPPSHVVTISAPDQRAEVPDSNELAVEGNRCRFRPICKKSNEVCGGKTKELCLVYGLNGTMQMPFMEEL